MGACTLDAAAVAKGIPARGIPAGEGRARKERSDCRVTDSGLYNAIVAHFGILSYVAIAVGISRAALYKRVERAPQLQAARDGARRVVVEVATYHLRKALSEGADWAVHFYMCRQDGIWFSMTEPREPKEPGEPREPREPKAEEPEESEPQPERANKSMLRLIRAVERGEPWAVKYCLNHLEPGGRYAKKCRGPDDVIAPHGFSQPGDALQSRPAPTLDESTAELADAYFDALFGKGPNPFDAPPNVADDAMMAAPTDVVETIDGQEGRTAHREQPAAFLKSAPQMVRRADAASAEKAAPTVETDPAPPLTSARASHHAGGRPSSGEPPRGPLASLPPVQTSGDFPYAVAEMGMFSKCSRTTFELADKLTSGTQKRELEASPLTNSTPVPAVEAAPAPPLTGKRASRHAGSHPPRETPRQPPLKLQAALRALVARHPILPAR